MPMLCEVCGVRAYSNRCVRHKVKKPLERAFAPPRKKPLPRPARQIAPESKKAYRARVATYKSWMKANPSDEHGYWTCYLHISQLCPVRLTRSMLTLEHVQPKVKRPDLKYDIGNIRPSCKFCNKLKGSRTPEQLAKIWPHLNYLVE